MRKEELKKIINNQGGITLTNKGTESNLKKGYIVSYASFEYTTKDVNDAVNRLIEYSKKIENKKGLFCGVWCDSGVYYVDINRYFDKYSQAMEFGRKNYQKAIWSNSKNDSIKLYYNITFYSIYSNVMEYVKQCDTMEELTKLFNVSANYIRKAIKENKTINNCYIYKDVINVQEL